MAKIAVDLNRALALRKQHGAPGATTSRLLARGPGWTVADVVCTHGPQDQVYEERHTQPTIAIVLAGSFQYRCPAGHWLMTPGALLLGSADCCFHCSHHHGEGDRCVAFTYDCDYFERLAADAGSSVANLAFPVSAIPPLSDLSPLVARASAGTLGLPHMPWEELAVDLAIRTIRLTAGLPSRPYTLPANAEARVTRVVRTIDQRPDRSRSLGTLANEARLSPYYFLRTFELVTGVTPHQYARRSRLREAATRLLLEPAKVLDVALDCGFGDISAFNRAFRSEFGVSPRGFRQSVDSIAPPL